MFIYLSKAKKPTYFNVIRMQFTLDVDFSVPDADWTLIFLEAYLCGGVINHAMTLAIHDISHNTVFGNSYPLSVSKH